MASSSVYQRGPGRVNANLTPMIDVVFLLMTFFMLVAQIQLSERVRVELPDVESGLAGEVEREGVVIVNVVPDAMLTEAGGRYRLGTRTFAGDAAGLASLEDAVSAARDRLVREGLWAGGGVLVRADRATPYERVAPVFGVLSRAGIAEARLMIAGDEPTMGVEQ